MAVNQGFLVHNQIYLPEKHYLLRGEKMKTLECIKCDQNIGQFKKDNQWTDIITGTILENENTCKKHVFHCKNCCK